MNTEINLIEQQPNKFAPFLKFGILFFVLALCVISFVLFQKNDYQSQIEIKSEKLAELESILLENRGAVKDYKKQERLISDVAGIRSASVPNLSVYKSILGLLSDSKQLIMYETLPSNQILVEAKFDTLPELAGYVSALLKLNYVKNTELTNVILVDSAYHATLTVATDLETLTKEFGMNE
ncbi:hypothetical protein [Virgibacillus sp. DJP39]|uniref:hypothetical protein n=1 Tax=Virgibacillus sp. DJP39 TaxID=3409790 RepID=UPI003BB4FD2E